MNLRASFTVKLPPQGLPEVLKLPAHPECGEGTLLWGRVTPQEAVVVLQMEGPSQVLRETVRTWRSRGFRVSTPDPGFRGADLEKM